MEGVENIASMFRVFPHCEHNRYTFNVDLVYFTECTAIIIVTGVFYEFSFLNQVYARHPRYFTRTFVLVKSSGNEFLISNDQLLISNATADQKSKFLNAPGWNLNNSIEVPLADSLLQKEELVKAFREITDMNEAWSIG